MKKLTFASGALLASLTTPAIADTKMALGAFGGMHFWNDNNELGDAPAEQAEELENSPIFGVRVGRRVHQLISVEGELGIAPTASVGSNTDVVALGYRLHALVHPVRLADDKLEPFALIGIGGFTVATTDTDVIRRDADFLWHAGVGVKYQVGRDWGLRFDARLLVPPAHDGLATIDGEVLVGVYRTFPPKPAAPPPPDPATTDGDDDGIADGTDQCATQAETANGYQDEDGCPDEPPAAVKQFTGVIRGIDFDTGSATLTPSSSKVLDEAVKVLREHPAIRLRISGHTDATGDPAGNRELSRQRAEAVKAYLTAGGIEAERLEAVGRGDEQPLGDNGSPEGRALNRRVEFEVR